MEDEYCCLVSDADQENAKLIVNEKEGNVTAIIISCNPESNLLNTRKFERSESHKYSSNKNEGQNINRYYVSPL